VAAVAVDELGRAVRVRPDTGGPPPDLPGYQVIDLLGRGGQGRAWLAWDDRGDRWVAVKDLILTGDPGADLPRRRSLAHEALALSRVDHPNLVRMLAYREEPVPHLVLEYCFGGALSARVSGDAGSLGSVAAPLVERLARAVGTLNAAGFIHRDLKPQNVLLREDGTPVVADLGLARLVSGTAPEDPPPAGVTPDDWRRLGTRTGQFAGTPEYAPPEAFGGVNRVGPPADVYGLGAVLYAMLTGRPPFTNRYEDIEGRVKNDPVVPVQELNPAVPPALEAVCLRCLEKDPARRYQTAEGLADDLERFRVGRRPEATIPGRVWRLGAAVRRVLRRVVRPLGETVTDPQTLFRTTFGLRPAELTARVEEFTRQLELRRSESGPSAAPLGSARTGPAPPPDPLRTDSYAAGPPTRPPTLPTLTGTPDLPPRPGRFEGRPSCLAVLNPLTWLRPREDPVDCSVFAPPVVPVGSRLIIYVFAHVPDRADEARQMAREFDEQAARRGFVVLDVDVRRRTTLAVHLALPEFGMPELSENLVWRGRTETVQFGITVPADLPTGTKIGTVRVCLGGVPVGHVKFRLDVVADATTRLAGPEPVGFDARRYERVFVSYASENRAEVLKRVQMLKLLRMQVFQDVLDLEPGDRWQRELYRHIDWADLFLLFWSSAARKSKWVRKELRYALKRKAGRDYSPPEILPVVIEGPPPPDPPTELPYLHFNDPVLYFIAPRVK
jgi:serine/threonine protein kinase